LKAFVIKSDGTAHATTIPNYQAMVEQVGGYLESVLFGPDAYAYVNENGIALKLPPNKTATELIEHFLAKLDRMLLPGDYIKGTLVVVGPPDDNGDETDVPEHVVAEIRTLLKKGR
jgi:hypothetical protein